MRYKDASISVVLPVYNNKCLAEESVRRVCVFLKKHFSSYEVIIVDDGSASVERLSNITMLERVVIIRNKTNKGKGFAIKRGMLAAKGDCRVFTDIDLPYSLDFILTAAQVVFSGDSHFVVGDRLHAKSTQEDSPTISRLCASFVFRNFLPVVVLGRSVDTQCGFKACSGLLAECLYPYVIINRFAFDMELFYLLNKWGG